MLKRLTKFPNASLIQNKIKFPDKFKGTIMEKWADYWKNLFLDYTQMLKDLRTDIQDEPKKAFLWSTGIFTAYILAQNNPTEIDFKDSLKNISNEIALVSGECRNPKAAEHLRFLETSYNRGLLRYRSLGLVSFIYVTELNEECDLYKAHCKYLQPSYLTILSQIIDVGFMGRWWNIYKKTASYDVNI